MNQKTHRKKSKSEKSKATELLNLKPFPEVLGQKLVSDVVKEMDKGTDKLECEDQLMFHKLYEPARIRFQEKISSIELTGAASTFPLLPFIAECTSYNYLSFTIFGMCICSSMLLNKLFFSPSVETIHLSYSVSFFSISF